MSEVRYVEADGGSIDLIRPLWEQLNEHHLALSSHFKPHYEQMTFEARKADLLKKERLRVITAYDDCHLVGYCVCSLSGDGDGEIDSIFIADGYRRSGIGEELLKRGIRWLDRNGARKKIVAVAAGNEAAIPFYEAFGFVPRMTVLQLIDEKKL